MVRDLRYWETLLASSMLQRPVKMLIDDDPGLEIWSRLQPRNLRSALAYAALTTKSGASERDLYEAIVGIPQYESWFGQLLDREEEKLIVEESFGQFQGLYRPIIKEEFKDVFEITEDG